LADPSTEARKPAGAIARFADVVVRARVAVVVFWIALAALLTVLLPTVEQAKTGELGDLVASEGEAADAERRAVELFGLPALSRTILVEEARGGFEPEELVALEARARDLRLGALPGLESLVLAVTVTDEMLGDAGEASAALTYLFFPPDIGPVGRTGLGRRLIERHGVEGPGRRSGLTGGVPARAEQISAIGDALGAVQLATLVAVTLLMGLYFRSLVAPLANVLAVALSYTIAVRALGGIGQGLGVAMPEELEPVMVALLFGIVTDYSIFFVSRFRSRLSEGDDPRDAAVRTTVDLAPIILTAGLSVAAACGVLIVARLGFFQAFGPGLAVAVLVAVALVLTLVPATLALLGKWTFWPRLDSARAGGRGTSHSPLRRLREAALALPVRRPVLVATVTSIPLLALSVGLLRIEVANTQISGLPESSGARQAAALAGRHFPRGAVAPLLVVVEGPALDERDAAIASLERRLANRRNVAEVVGPTAVEPALDPGAMTAGGGEAVRILMVLDVNPLGSRGIRTAGRLREDLGSILEQSGLGDAEASVGGDAAVAEETVRRTGEDLGRVVPAATLVVVAILAVFLRALVAPLYLVAASLLSLAASLGLTVLVFQDLLDYGELTFYVPFAGVVLLVALGSDYNVYLVGRVWEEARRRPVGKAIAVASQRASSAISAAGVVLAFSFALLAIVPLRPFRELAFLLCVGLLIDAFVVRSMLAPALIARFGETSAWPGRGLRRIARRPPRRGSDGG
jgi:putative drug exporter of the RND superfamily